MRLNFNDFNLYRTVAKNDFEQQVLDFIKFWFSDEKYISVQTSGSTGIPKNIRVEKEKMRNSAKMTCDFLKLESGNSAVLCLPVEYISGKMVIVRAIERKLILNIENSSLKPFEDFSEKVDFCAMTPLQVENTLDKISRIDKLIIGGAKVSTELKLKIQKKILEEQAKTIVYETYGMSETLSHIALRQIAPNEDTYFTAFDEVKITVDERNCLQISAPMLNSEVLQTNDIVDLVNDKQFQFIGRTDFIINSGGLKISPEILEKLVKKEINSELIFVGIFDKILSEKLVLVIEGEKQDLISEKLDLINFPTKNHRPKEFYFLKSFPRTETGKIMRLDIKKLIEKL
ncbi:AMP-binding protein [Halpernia sp. GG3]